MRYTGSRLTASFVLAAALGAAATGARAAEPPGAPPAASVAPMDPALKSALSGIAASLLAEFAARLAAGSTDGFDPGPAIERTVSRVLASADLDRLIDGMLAQGLAPGNGIAADLPPELRAAIALVIRSAAAGARRELSREFGR